MTTVVKRGTRRTDPPALTCRRIAAVAPHVPLELPGERTRARWRWFGITCAVLAIAVGAKWTIGYLAEMPLHPPQIERELSHGR